MRIKFWTLLLALPLLAASCSGDPEEQAAPAPGTIRVTVGSGPGIDIESRTALDPDGQTVRWATGDKIALWATNAAGTAQLSAHRFELWHYNETYNQAKFTADIPEMPDGEYTYCAVSPLPAATDGTRASFDIPSEQDGAFSGACDILVATPVTGGALLPGDNSEAVNLAFSHKVHLLKIHIPANKMNLPITRLTLTFPVAVTGQLTVDAARPGDAPQLSGGSNTLTLAFATPKDAGDTVYATIAPTELTSADQIEIKAYTDTKESHPAIMRGKSYLAGHTTPIELTIPEIFRITHIYFSLAGRDGRTDIAEDLAGGYGCSTLGERVNAFTLTGPAGTDLGNGSNVRTFTVNDANRYALSYEGEFTDNLSGQPFTVTFDSENTVTSRSFTMPQLTADTHNTIGTFVVPWLYSENFNTATSLETNSDWKSTNFSDTSAAQIQNLPSGWTGACVGGEAGVGIRVASHCIHGLFTVYTRCPGRVDSPSITAIKSGKTPKVQVTYTYGGDRYEGVGSGGAILVSAGYTTPADDNNTPISSNNTIENIKIPEAAINIDGSQNNSKNYSLGSSHSQSYTIDQCPHGTRLGWRVYNNRTGTGNGTYWLYIDNIRVSIAQ